MSVISIVTSNPWLLSQLRLRIFGRKLIMREIWKPIGGYAGRYEISNYGRVKTLGRFISKNSRRGKKYLYFRKGRVLKQNYSACLYPRVTVWRKPLSKTMLVHRIVAEHFIPNPENKLCINHKDGNKLNNNVGNLEWCSYSENSYHAYKSGLMAEFQNVGEKNGRAILGNEAVLTIREVFNHMSGLSKQKYRELAQIFGVSISTTTRIIKNTHWKIKEV